MSAAGLSNLQIAMPAIRFSVLVSIVGYILAFYIAPTSYHFLKKRLNNFHDHYFKNVIHTGSFNPISKNFTLYIDHKKGGNILSEIIIFDNRNSRENAIIFAREGSLYLENNTPTFKLFDGTRQVIDRKGNMNQMVFEDLKISLPQGKTERTISSMEMMEYNIFQLLLAKKDQLNTQKLSQVRAELHQRLTWSAYSIVIALITLGIFLNKPYTRSPEYKTAIKATGACLLVLYIHFTLHNMASKNNIYIIFSYMNLILSGLYGYYLLNRKSS
jgi:lipopolysaccharide export LptBFGC system permease protein LptF